MSRTSQPTAPGGGITADILKAATAESNTDVLAQAAASGRFSSKFSVPDALVKGTRMPGEKPLEDFDKIMGKQQILEKTFMASIHKSTSDPMGVIAGLPLASPFRAPLAGMLAASPTYQLSQAMKNIDKSFTLTSPLTSGLVPYDLSAPTMLIYPVYTPLRNRIPRPAGQGKSHEAKVITSILGSQPGIFANPSQRMSIPELPAGGGLSNWPNQLPASGSQTSVDVNIPYKFFGLTEAATWLAQFSGQGFDDIAALATLILLQEFMLGEEKSIIGGTGFNLNHTMTITGTPRAAGTGETAISGATTDVYAYVTAVNYYGETIASVSSGAIAVTNGTSVVDLTIANQVPGALAYNIYIATGTADPGHGGAHFVVTTGSTIYTLQGALPTTTATPPTADTGTGSTNDYEGIFSILSGHAAANAGSGYPSSYEGGYIDQSVQDILSVSVVANALQQVYNGGSNNYFADPAELWCSAIDAKNLSDDLVLNGNDLNYSIFVNQDQVSNVIAGIAVSQFTNPVTRSTLRITVHPYFPQGSAVGMSYTLPQVQTNVSNVWENVMVQDYISINWPVIDVTFRYSMFMYGTLFSPAPQYNFLLQGLQGSNTKPYF